ncbi:MAG: FkbM family methyltransferase [Bacteroidota bacterium]|nr:FkbM family methyltransferase [Bacteroidota bacterium]
MHKIITFLRYLKDFIKQGEFSFIPTAIRYQLRRMPASSDRIYKSSLGTFATRKGTIDFMFANYAYEWNVKKFVLKHYRDYNVFFDIGANIGTYSIMLANKGLKCYAFEPSMSNFNIMQKNISLNGLENRIHALNIGLGEHEHMGEFLFNPVNTGASHFKKEGLNDTGIKEKLRIRPLDDIFEEFMLNSADRVFMKIDVEGMEVEVIKGARKFLSNFNNLLIVMESKHSESLEIRKELDKLSSFDYWTVDQFNIATKKTKPN